MHTSSGSTCLLALCLTLNLSPVLAQPSSSYEAEPCLPALISFLTPRYMSALGIRRQNCPQSIAHHGQREGSDTQEFAHPSLFRRSVNLASDYYKHLRTVPIDRPRVDEGELYGREFGLTSEEGQEEQEQETGQTQRKQRRVDSPTRPEQDTEVPIDRRLQKLTVRFGAEREEALVALDADQESRLRSAINRLRAAAAAGPPHLSKLSRPTIEVSLTDASPSNLLNDVELKVLVDEHLTGLSISQPFTGPQSQDPDRRPCTGKLDVARFTRRTWRSLSRSVEATIKGVDENAAAIAAIAVGIFVLVLLAIETLVAGRRGTIEPPNLDEEKRNAEMVTRGRTMARRQRGRAWWMYTRRCPASRAPRLPDMMSPIPEALTEKSPLPGQPFNRTFRHEEESRSLDEKEALILSFAP